ncbi:MAG: hypothetical protein QXT89_00920 [Candidatus Micrarchaeaceae archaeon]
MKIQTSLEFLLVLGAIGTLTVTVVGIYSSKMHYEQAIFSNVISNSSPTNLTISKMQASKIYVIPYLPLNTTIYQQSQLYIAVYGCTNGTAEFHLSSNSMAFAASNLHSQLSGVGMLTTEFEPLKVGANIANINYSIECNNHTESNETSLSTFSTESLQGSQLSARISNRHEYINYPFESKTGLFALKEWSHCTYHDFWGNPLPTLYQCGANAWSYMVFSGYCYTNDEGQTVTFCIAPYSTGVNLSYVSASDMGYSYNFTLSIYALNNIFSGNLSSTSRTSEIFLGKSVVGNATVLNVSGISTFSNEEILSEGNHSGIANSSAYTWYVQAKNNLYSILGYYNDSGVSSATQAQIQQTVSAYSDAYSNLLKSVSYNLTSCSFLGSSMVCNAIEPFSYYIAADIQGLDTNSTISYMGSIITTT